MAQNTLEHLQKEAKIKSLNILNFERPGDTISRKVLILDSHLHGKPLVILSFFRQPASPQRGFGVFLRRPPLLPGRPVGNVVGGGTATPGLGVWPDFFLCLPRPLERRELEPRLWLPGGWETWSFDSLCNLIELFESSLFLLELCLLSVPEEIADCLHTFSKKMLQFARCCYI